MSSNPILPGVSINVPDQQLAAAFPTAVEILLSDGRMVKMRKAKGRDLVAAGRITASKKDVTNQFKLMMAMIAQVILIADQPVNLFQIEDLDLVDFNKVQRAYINLHPGLGDEDEEVPQKEEEENQESSSS